MSIKALITYGFPFGPQGEHNTDTALGIAQGTQREALGIVHTFAQEAQAAQDNADLTVEGKAKAKRAAGDRAVAALKNIASGPSAVRLAGILKNAEARLDKSLPGDTDSAAQAVREWEVRERLDAMNKSERHAALRHAAEVGDWLVLNAIKNAPSIVEQYLPVETIDTIIGDLIAKRSPGEARALATAKEARQIVDKSLTDAENAIASEAGINPDNAVRIRALEPNRSGGGAAA